MSTAYDAFAWFYNRYWNQPFHSRAFAVVDRVLLSRLPAGAHLLDVGCGTGYLAGLLAARGFAVTGVDAAREMVRYARGNVPRARFLCGDVTRVRLGGPFDAALSTFDTVNHIIGTEALAAVFGNISGALAPGGLFLFDVLVEEAYREHWRESFAIVEDDHVLAITGSGFDEGTRLAHCRITMFRRARGWKRSDTTVTERCYTRAEIGAALASAGFGDVNCYDARDMGMEGDLGAGRVFFLARRGPGLGQQQRKTRKTR